MWLARAFEVQGSAFHLHHKPSECNSPAAPPSGWSGGTLDKPWTYSGTIEPIPDPFFDQARLSKSVSRGSSARSRCSALDVGCSGPVLAHLLCQLGPNSARRRVCRQVETCGYCEARQRLEALPG